jgi:hypothetical protein
MGQSTLEFRLQAVGVKHRLKAELQRRHPETSRKWASVTARLPTGRLLAEGW